MKIVILDGNTLSPQNQISKDIDFSVLENLTNSTVSLTIKKSETTIIKR